MLLVRHLCRMMPIALHLLKQPPKSWQRSDSLCLQELIMLLRIMAREPWGWSQAQGRQDMSTTCV